MPTCYRCGGPADIDIEDGSAVCEACEEDYQSSLRAAYPYGQCQQCGAVYNPVTCEQGKTHVVAGHAEGACSNWSDGGEPLDVADLAEGYCSYGCRPARPVYTPPTGPDPEAQAWLDNLKAYVEAHPLPDDDLPF